MSNSRAAQIRAGVLYAKGPHARAAVRFVGAALALVALLGGLASAQSAPVVGVDAYEYKVGDVLHLTGDGLTPGASYRVSVTPAGSVPLVAMEIANGLGAIRFSAPLTEAGDHSVNVAGPDINATFTVAVTAAPTAPAGAAPGAVEGEPQGAAPQEAAPAPPAVERPPAAQPEPTQPAPTEPAPAQSAPTEPAPTQPQSGATPPAATQTPQEATPASPPAVLGYPVVQSVDGAVKGMQNGQALWTLAFPVGSGETAGLFQAGTDAYVGHGNSVLVVDARTGVVQKRYRLPAQVTSITNSAGVPLAAITYSNGAEGRIAILSSGPEASEPFDVDPKLYGWLRTEALGENPTERLRQDPTNPWLYLEAARAAQPGSNDEARYIDGALANAATFYERAQLARELMRFSPPQREAAASAMYGALSDFVARGYRAELLFDETLAETYGFPLGALQAALGRGDIQAAGFWADWVYPLSTPAVPATQAALRDYADYLRADGQREAASQWLERSREGAGFDLAAAIRQAALDVGRTGWYGVAALLVALIALYVTLAAKYWRAQSLNLRRNSGKGGGARLFFLRYATFTERLVAVLLLAAAMALTGLQGWARDGDALPAAWGSGSLASVPSLDALARTSGSGPDIGFVRGYAEQTAGLTDPAAEAYRTAPNDADAVNNLGVLTNDPALYQRALDLKPGLPAANFNLGQGSNPSRLMAAFAPDDKALVVPDETRLRSAVTGTFLEALANVFTNPWAALTGVAGVGVAQWVWLVIVVAFLIVVLFNLIQLVLPRPRLARNAPRTPLYHVLAVLLPGTGQADEFWGLLLAVPWAIFGVDLLLHYVPMGVGPAISYMTDLIALGVIYLINLVTFFVELASYNRRMQALKVNDPQTAREYGMRVGA